HRHALGRRHRYLAGAGDRCRSAHRSAARRHGDDLVRCKPATRRAPDGGLYHARPQWHRWARSRLGQPAFDGRKQKRMNSIGRRSALAGMVGTVAVTQSRLAWAADPIKIGFSIPQSGGLAALGRQALLTMEIWANDVNAKGGMLGRPVQLVTYDDQSNPANVPPIYTKLLDIDKVDLIVTQGTNLTVPAMPIAMQHGKMVLTMLA